MCQIAYRILSIAYRQNGEGKLRVILDSFVVWGGGGNEGRYICLVWSVPQDFLHPAEVDREDAGQISHLGNWRFSVVGAASLRETKLAMSQKD